MTPQYDLIDGKRLRFSRNGRGTPILFLHGYPDTLTIFRAIEAELADRFDVIAFDWPGIGESEAWLGGATPFDLGKRVVRLLDHWRIERAIIAGHDMGGQAALAVAATAPSRVVSCVV